MGSVSDIRPACARCNLTHNPVSFGEWAEAIRDSPELPKAGHTNILLVMTRFFGKAGCGFASIPFIAKAARVSESTVKRALRWAQDRGFLIQTRQGHAVEHGLGVASEWQLAVPGVSTMRPDHPVMGDHQAPAQKPELVVTHDPQPMTPIEVKDTEANASAPEGDSTMARTPARPTQDALFAVPAPPPRQDTQTLVAEWIAHCPTPPPTRVRGQVCRLIKEMLDEGIEYRHVRAGLARWHQRALNPSVLPSVVNQVMNGGPSSEEQAQFAQFWDAYPRRAKPQDAMYWFRRVLADGTSFETVMLGVKKLRAALDAGFVEARYVLNPDSWLRAGSWDDEYAQGDSGMLTEVAVFR